VNNVERVSKRVKVDLTDSGFPMIFATALVEYLRMSEATTMSTGMFVKRFKVGIAICCYTHARVRGFGASLRNKLSL